jgi:hypothetical protein
LVIPGAHHIRISLPGYQTFETEINAVAQQKLEIKTNLLEDPGAITSPHPKPSSGDTTIPPPPPPPNQ